MKMIGKVMLVTSVALMLAFILTRNKKIGTLAWFLFGVYWLILAPFYYSIRDYYNSSVFTLAFIFFTYMAFKMQKARNLNVFIEVTSFSFLSCLIYFTVFFSFLKQELIEIVAEQTAAFVNLLGYNARNFGDLIELNSRYIKIILPCTGIESMALFAGATLGIKADIKRKIAAFAVSVPVIYFLNILRNSFVLLSHAYMWFGENSFFYAHHVISKVLATLALIGITLAVFKALPELEKLIISLKDELIK